MKKQNHLIIVVAGILFAACSTMTVKKVTTAAPAKDPGQGIYYALPKLKYDIAITIEKTEFTPSEFYNEASPTSFETEIKKLQDRIDYIKAAKTTYKIKNIEIIERAVPDENELYFIKFLRNNALFLKKKYEFELNDKGFLTASTNNSEDNTVKFFSETVKGLGDVLVSTFKAATPAGAPGNGGVYNDLAILVAQINKLKNMRLELLSGKALDSFSNVPVEVMYKNLLNEENKLLELLYGTKETESTQYLVSDVDPTLGSQPIFYFSETQGGNLLAQADASYKPVTLNLSSSSALANLTSHNSTRSNTGRNTGIFYRIPTHVIASVKYNSKDLLRKETIVPQLGKTSHLPSRICIRSNEITVGLDPVTGALKKITANGDGLDPAISKELLSKAAEIKEKEKNQKSDETIAKEKEIAKLELEIKQKELEQKLDTLNNAGNNQQ